MVTRPQFPQQQQQQQQAPATAVAASFHEKAWVEQYTATSAKVQPNSIEMLARFQQKQLQEKEQKLLQLYDQQQQRAHQVAQRGSAGSNGSTSQHNSAAKVKQLFTSDERPKQNGVKGIDKSYPLDPLKTLNKKSPSINKTTPNSNNNNNSIVSNNNNNNNMTNRKLNSKVAVAGGTRRVIKADVNSNSSSNRRENNFVAASSSSRQQHQENFSSSRESYGTTTTTTRYSSNEATTTNNATAGESIRQQVNGHAKNGYHYEINIDDVIDNEALQRNRMLAKFQPGDIERRRRQMSAATGNDIDIEVDTEFPEDCDYSSASRKSSLKNAKSNPMIATTKKTTTTTTNPRSSTVMKPTTSAKLKQCQPASNRNRLVLRRKSTLVRKPNKPVEKPKRKKIVQAPADRCCEISERCFPPPWNTLKSTSLICEIIRKHSKLQQLRNKSKMGRVKTIVTKIENQVGPTSLSTITGARNSATAKYIPVAKTIEKRLLEMTRNVEPVASTSQEPLELLNANFVEALKAAERNEEDQGDGLVPNGKEVSLSLEQLQACPAPRRLSAEDVNRIRRKSFELKRLMFEQLLAERRQRFSRHNSVESALRHFDKIDVDDKHHDKKPTQRGFERSTSAWTIRTSNLPTRKKSQSKKILEARDSIELARVPVLTNMPACKKKIIRKSCENDDARVNYGYQSRRDRSHSPEILAKLDFCHNVFGSKTEVALKKADSITKVDREVKNVTPYPSSKSPDNTETKSRGSVVKSTSLKLLSRFSGGNSNGDASNETTDGPAPNVRRKSSIHATVDNEEKLPTAGGVQRVTPAPRTSPSSSSVGPTRSQGNRPTTKAKTPTPAARTTAPFSGSANADDSLITCKICTRRFQSERIAKHEQICAKTAQKKRKQFDAVGHRVRGTELESFVQKPNKKQSKAAAAAAAAAANSKTESQSQKSNWRRKHEDFINAIRSAKQMQAHLAAGGKLSDLPPPPPTDTSDYVQCPHCSRKFNQGAAERHIPKCETMQHNKPKPRAKR